MRIGIYGGHFNPPHLGHKTGALRAAEQLKLDKLIIIPSGTPPHKEIPPDTPSGEHRLEMTRLAFRHIPNAEVSDIEIRRPGESYTADTVREIAAVYPGAEFFLIIGTDMFLTLDKWYDSEYILKTVTPAVTMRYSDGAELIAQNAEKFVQRGVTTAVIRSGAIEISSSDVRKMLAKRDGTVYIDDSVYWYIIGNGLYGAKPDFDSLRRRAYLMLDKSRINHVAGCEEEAVRLAKRWGADVSDAREAAILHDITKKLELAEHLDICEKYGIIPDAVEMENGKLLHAKTASALAKYEFNVNNDTADAILWHTTGRAGMSLLEKIIYLADYIEPNRDLENVELLRQLAYEDIDKAVILGLQLCHNDLVSRGKTMHPATIEALKSFTERVSQ